jgi:hypothetical protein
METHKRILEESQTDDNDQPTPKRASLLDQIQMSSFYSKNDMKQAFEDILDLIEVLEGEITKQDFTIIERNLTSLHEKYGIDQFELEKRVQVVQEYYPNCAIEILIDTSPKTIDKLFKELFEDLVKTIPRCRELFDPHGACLDENTFLHNATEALNINPWVVLGPEKACDALKDTFRHMLDQMPEIRHSLIEPFINEIVLGQEISLESFFLDNVKQICHEQNYGYTFRPTDQELETFFAGLVPSLQPHLPCSVCGSDLNNDEFQVQCKGCRDAFSNHPETHWIRQSLSFNKNRTDFLSHFQCCSCKKPSTSSHIESPNYEARPWCSDCYLIDRQDADFNWIEIQPLD